MLAETLFDDGIRSWTFFGRDPKRPNQIIDTNEYLVTHGDRGMLLDPGGIEVFPVVVAAVSRHIDLSQIEALFASHQDPDIISSLSLWVKLIPDLVVHCPSIWTGFISHFGFGATLEAIEDQGRSMRLGASNDLQAIPAHYCHSSGNFSVYDARARILFSGDIGSALLPPEEATVTVKDFDHHIDFMEGFHRRWMPSMKAKTRWIDRVRHLDIEMICPQHGAVFAGADVHRFLEWFSELEVGSAS
jgi:flavorubredoxin